MSMEECVLFQEHCDPIEDYPGGATENSHKIDAVMGNIGKHVNVLVSIKWVEDTKYINVKSISFV